MGRTKVYPTQVLKNTSFHLSVFLNSLNFFTSSVTPRGTAFFTLRPKPDCPRYDSQTLLYERKWKYQNFLTEAVSVILVSDPTLRRDLKSEKVSFETDAKGCKRIGVSELTRVYELLDTENGTPSTAALVKDTPQNP